jgi:hypothetical protein
MVLQFGVFELLLLNHRGFVLVDHRLVLRKISEVYSASKTDTFIHRVDDAGYFSHMFHLIVNVSHANKLTECLKLLAGLLFFYRVKLFSYLIGLVLEFNHPFLVVSWCIFSFWELFILAGNLRDTSFSFWIFTMS